MAVRRAALAGTGWYPGKSAECRREIESLLRPLSAATDPDREFVGGIVPHAGWYFSGGIACNVIHCLKKGDAPDVIVIFGMHLHPSSPAYIMRQGAWETPLGEIQVQEDLAGELAERFTFQIETTTGFAQDNTIEVQLPFIKYFFPDTKIVPIGVPPDVGSLEIGVSAVEISANLGLNAKVIGSTDLTHYGNNYGFTSKGTGKAAYEWVRDENDRRVINMMLAMDAEEVIREALASQNACCSGAAATAIAAGKQLGAQDAQIIAYENSYEKSPGDSFVGYVGIAF